MEYYLLGKFYLGGIIDLRHIFIYVFLSMIEALDSEKDSKTTFRVIDSTWCTIFATAETTDALGTSIPNDPRR